MGRKTSEKFNNISLVYKIMIILSGVLIFVFLVYMCSIGIIIREYNKILYNEKAATIKYALNSLESKMKEIEKISESVLINDNIQSRAVKLYESNDDKRIPVIKREFYNALLLFNFSDNYIKNIEFISVKGSIVNTGEEIKPDKIWGEEIKNNKGNSLWLALHSGEAVLGREIRKIRYLTLENLGELYINVNFERMLKDSFLEIGYDISPDTLAVKSGNLLLYPGEAVYGEENIWI